MPLGKSALHRSGIESSESTCFACTMKFKSLYLIGDAVAAAAEDLHHPVAPAQHVTWPEVAAPCWACAAGIFAQREPKTPNVRL